MNLTTRHHKVCSLQNMTSEIIISKSNSLVPFLIPIHLKKEQLHLIEYVASPAIAIGIQYS